ncbi:MAG: magnesium protoporphyrin IX methyltransferase [Pseudomonadota bacterium]
MNYSSTLSRVETYFDQTATKTWEQLTSTAPVSKVRETVRKGRDEMRALMLSRLPIDLSGQRVLDAGCGTGLMTEELARRGAQVTAIDISPNLIDIARKRIPVDLQSQIDFRDGDMLDAGLGQFNHVIAMDSLIYYTADDIGQALTELSPRVSGKIIFTVAPRTPFLMLFWYAGKLFPKKDRSPVMIPHKKTPIARAAHAAGARGKLRQIKRISSGFYTSQALEFEG